nr:hypothetical protein Iba_scaffold1558703CG0010 [Ipomoea batatas]GME16289.1 hypothetical protein Iba_scaffold17287CG0070 [Ipomoea batatas]
MSLPELKPTSDNPWNEDDGMLSLQSFLSQLDAGGIRRRPCNRLRDVLRERGRHRIIEEKQNPPHCADASDEPAATVEAGPVALPLALASRHPGRPALLLSLVIRAARPRNRRFRLLDFRRSFPAD